MDVRPGPGRYCGGDARCGGIYRIHLRSLVPLVPLFQGDGFVIHLIGAEFGDVSVLRGSNLLNGMLGWIPIRVDGPQRNIHG